MTATTTPRPSKRLMAGLTMAAMAIIAEAALAFGPGGDEPAANPAGGTPAPEFTFEYFDGQKPG